MLRFTVMRRLEANKEEANKEETTKEEAILVNSKAFNITEFLYL